MADKVKVLKALAFAILLVVNLLMVKEQYDVYREDPVGTSISRVSMEELPFPAVTICDSYYQNRKAHEDLNFPRNVFGKAPKQVLSNPLDFYRRLDTYELEVVPNMWRFYYTLDKKLVWRSDKSYDSQVDYQCRVGTVSCGYRRSDVLVPEGDAESVEVEVPAGRWTSRFVADSSLGKTHLCHTLVPNVTANFDDPRGFSIALMWNHAVQMASPSNQWKVYVHDRRERVAISPFVMDGPAAVVVENPQKGSFDYGHKALMLPRVHRRPSPPTERWPCQAEEDYSETRCNIEWGWGQKLKEMREFYGERFKCRIPGVWTDEDVEVEPVCNHYEATPENNHTVGLKELIYTGYLRPDDTPTLTVPVIGSYKKTSGCLPRCESVTYTLVEEKYEADDGDSSDLLLRFGSPAVEVWEEYHVVSSLDFLVGIGGLGGLVLGTSLLSCVFIVVDAVAKGVKKTPLLK